MGIFSCVAKIENIFWGMSDTILIFFFLEMGGGGVNSRCGSKPTL